MRLIVLMLALSMTGLLSAQTYTFRLDPTLAEDKWVVLPANEKGEHPYGFVYIDLDAGFTFDLKGFFTFKDMKPVADTSERNFSYKIRLQPKHRMDIMSEEHRQVLRLPVQPEWLANYKGDIASSNYFLSRGFHYNALGNSMAALPILLTGWRMDSNYNGIATELAYTYNALGDYVNAERVLKYGLKKYPAECLIYKELAFAQAHAKDLAEAEGTAMQGIDVCKDDNWKSEMAYNLAYQYYLRKNRQKYEHWKAITLKWAKPGDNYSKNLAIIDEEYK